jgi:hypothetical protein
MIAPAIDNLYSNTLGLPIQSVKRLLIVITNTMVLNTPTALAICHDLTTAHNINQHNTIQNTGRIKLCFGAGNKLPNNNIPIVMTVSPVRNILSICWAQVWHLADNCVGNNINEHITKIPPNRDAI